jgi:hypothetical protein
MTTNDFNGKLNIGVTIFINHDADEGQYAEVAIEYPQLWRGYIGKNVPARDGTAIDTAAEAAKTLIVEKIDECIAELSTIRAQVLSRPAEIVDSYESTTPKADAVYSYQMDLRDAAADMEMRP